MSFAIFGAEHKHKHKHGSHKDGGDKKHERMVKRYSFQQGMVDSLQERIDRMEEKHGVSKEEVSAKQGKKQEPKEEEQATEEKEAE